MLLLKLWRHRFSRTALTLLLLLHRFLHHQVLLNVHLVLYFLDPVHVLCLFLEQIFLLLIVVCVQRWRLTSWTDALVKDTCIFILVSGHWNLSKTGVHTSLALRGNWLLLSQLLLAVNSGKLLGHGGILIRGNGFLIEHVTNLCLFAPTSTIHRPSIDHLQLLIVCRRTGRLRWLRQRGSHVGHRHWLIGLHGHWIERPSPLWLLWRAVNSVHWRHQRIIGTTAAVGLIISLTLGAFRSISLLIVILATRCLSYRLIRHNGLMVYFGMGVLLDSCVISHHRWIIGST